MNYALSPRTNGNLSGKCYALCFTAVNIQKPFSIFFMEKSFLMNCVSLWIPSPNKQTPFLHFLYGKEFFIECKKFRGAYICLDEASVMATENAIMAAVLAQGETTIYNAACEPHVQGLCNLLKKMGARIEGVGSNLLRIIGVRGSFSFIILSLMIRSKTYLESVITSHLIIIIISLP